MKLLKLILLLITINLNAQESRFKEGETLNVWAQSGLNMRDKPDGKAPKLTTIPYGAKVVVQLNIGVKIPFEVEEFKGFIVKGYWLLVKYGNTEGFVFDGFLSRLPTPINIVKEGLEEYLDKNIGKVGKKYEVEVLDVFGDTNRLVKPNEKYEENSINGYKQKYKSNILFDYRGGEAGISLNLILPNLTLYEGYFFVKTFYFDEKTDIFSYKKQEKKIEMSVKEEGAGCYYSIEQKGNKVIIDGGCGC